MGPIKVKAVVPKDHRVEISLPPEVPEGPVELEVRVAASPEAADGPDRMLEVLAELREARRRYVGPPVLLSAAVSELRNAGG